MERLRFGDEASLKLVNLAPTLLSAHRDLKETTRRVNRRQWAKPGQACARCNAALQQGDVQIRMGRRAFHDRCLVGLIVEVRRDLRTLGYNVETLHGGERVDVSMARNMATEGISMATERDVWFHG